MSPDSTLISENETELKILDILKKKGELHVKAVAEQAKVSQNTASKYLSGLEKGGKVISRLQKPYKLYRLKE